LINGVSVVDLVVSKTFKKYDNRRLQNKERINALYVMI